MSARNPHGSADLRKKTSFHSKAVDLKNIRQCFLGQSIPDTVLEKGLGKITGHVIMSICMSFCVEIFRDKSEKLSSTNARFDCK